MIKKICIVVAVALLILLSIMLKHIHLVWIVG